MEIEFENSGVHEVNSAKKESIFERLNKRNKERQNFFDVKQEQRCKENLDHEGADYFSQSFSERVREIEENIRNIAESSVNSHHHHPNEKQELLREFANITSDIRELQQYLTNSTIFLTDYKIKACQNILNGLNILAEETRLRLMPKKKFGFSSKKVTSKIAVNPKVNLDSIDCAEKSSITASVFTWTLCDKADKIIKMYNDDVNGKDITISNVSNCLIEIQGHPGSVQISNALNCIFLCGPISRSMFAENCKNCTIAVACQQLRLHTSAGCKIFLHVTCRAIIEDCKQIEIFNYNYDYDSIDSDFQKAGLDKSHNNYKDIADFNWLSPDVPSPNWKLGNLEEQNNSPDWTIIRQKFKEKLSS